MPACEASPKNKVHVSMTVNHQLLETGRLNLENRRLTGAKYKEQAHTRSVADPLPLDRELKGVPIFRAGEAVVVLQTHSR